MNNFNIIDKKILMKKKRSTINKKPLIIILSVMAFTIVFINNTNNIFGIDNQNNSINPTIAPNNTSTENKEKICNDLRQAFVNGDGEKIKTITETYPSSGDYCGY